MAPKRTKNENSQGANKVAKNDEIDPRFNFDSKEIDWTSNMSKQLLKYTYVKVLDPTHPLTDNNGSLLNRTDVTFELPPNGTFLPGNQTRFYVEGIFEKKEEADLDWSAIPSTEASKVIISPNWFEKLIEEVKVISTNGSSLALNDQPQYISAYMNEMLYAHMHPELKNYLCKEECHPGNAGSLTRSKWNFDGADWVKYAPSIFKGDKFRFSYVPLETWPFFQNGNFVLDAKQPPKAVNLSLFPMGQVKIRFNTNFSNGDNIFRKKEGNITEYRVRITDIKLALEMAEDYKDPFPKNGVLQYIGTSKIVKNNDVQSNVSWIKFDNISLPTSLLFFFLPKTVVSGTTSFKDETEYAGFRKHDLENIQVKFNMEDLYHTNTDRDAYLGLYDATNLENHLKYPISGIPVDKNTMTLKQLLEDGTNYAFPHTYIRLSPGYHQRLMPATGKTDQLQHPGTLEIGMMFVKNGQLNKDLTVLVYAFYDDYNNVIADVKNKTFFNPMMKIGSN
jgi:hypothetical protein